MATYHINFLGDGGVGKTTWIHKMKTDEFYSKYYATVGCDVHPFMVNTNYGNIELNLYDYAGQEKYSSRTYYKHDANILMFDLTSKVSHESLKDWYTKCYTGQTFIVGNKCDIAEIKVTPSFHEKHNLPYIPVSAKRMTLADLLTPILRSLTGHDDLVIV